jgi:sulfite oxidase
VATGERLEPRARFGKHPAITVWQAEPFNAEPPSALLRSPLTATDGFYVRSHGPVPEIAAHEHRIPVGGLVEHELAVSLGELRSEFEQRTLTVTLQCAGNRRGELMAVKDIEGEIPWGPAVIGTATWTGVALADVLARAGLDPRAEHVEAIGAEDLGAGAAFGGSIPLAKALSPEVLLAYEMNGEPLLPVHGAPVRLVVPGYIGARSVKWLSAVRVRDSPSPNHFQASSYRLHPPGLDEATARPEDGFALGEVGVNAAVLAPTEGEEVAPGTVPVEGYAITGGASRVERVDVSTDGGRTWTRAQLAEDQGRWAWRLWRAEVELPEGEGEIVARAVDSSANTQPENPATIWNWQGYANNAWSRVRIKVVEPARP